MTQLPKGPGIGEESFGFLLQTLSRRMEKIMREKLHEVGIDFKIFANLMMLYSEDGVNQRELGKRLDFPEYYTSRNVDALVNEGYAERRPDPESRRSYLIFLTDKGRKKASELPTLIRGVNATFLSSLEEEENAELLSSMRKIVKATNSL